MKRITSDCEPTRSLLSWLNSTLNSQETQVEKLGNGLAYCLLMHHFYPTIVPIKRICLTPRRHHEIISNLRLLSQALCTVKLTHISFDINKVSTFSYFDNLQLLTKLRLALSKSQAPLNKSGVEPLHTNVISKNALNKKNQRQPAKNNNANSMQKNNVLNRNQFQMIQLGIVTPMKIPINYQNNVLDEIKTVVGSTQSTDREKVKLLKNLLGIQIQETKYQQEDDEKDLLSDENKKEAIIVIDES